MQACKFFFIIINNKKKLASTQVGGKKIIRRTHMLAGFGKFGRRTPPRLRPLSLDSGERGSWG